MTYKVILLTTTLFGFVFLYSCSKEKKPKNLIPEETYIEILVELQVAKTSQEFVQDSVDMQKAMQQIFTHYEVSYEQFVQSHRYYSEDVRAQNERLKKALDTFQQKRTKERERDSKKARGR